MDAQLTLTDKQKLIDIFTESYSPEDIFAIGRLIGIDKNYYYGFGMNAMQLAEAFVNNIVQKEKVDILFETLANNERYYRKAFNEFALTPTENDKHLPSFLKAIVIGINEYDWGGGANNLNFATSDADKFILFLKNKWGIDERDILQYTQNALYSEIMNGIKKLCSSLDERNNLLFFFSGHGIEYNGHSYLAVTDTVFDSSGKVLNAISLEELNDIFKNCKANLKIRLFDACKCGERFCKDFDVKDKMTKCIKKEILADGNGWITFCSCDIDEYSHELVKLQHGVFTYFLLKGLEGAARRGTGKMYIEDLKIYICDNVPKAVTPLNSQNPQYQCEIEGNILIE